jgi:hypothetical protein
LRKRTINLVLSTICLTFISLTLIPLFLGYTMGPQITRQILEQEIEDLLQQRVEVDRAGFTIFGGFGIEYRNLKILGPEGKEFFRAQAFLLRPWIQSLILGQLRWKSMILKNPSIHLIRTSEGIIHLSRKRTEKPDKKDMGILQQLREAMSQMPSHLSVLGGRIRLTDSALSPSPVVTEVQEIDLTSHAISPGKSLSFRLTGRFARGLGQKFTLSSKISCVDQALTRDCHEFQISLKADSIDFQGIRPYVRSAAPFERLEGLLDLKIRYRGGLTSFHSSGEMKIRHGQFTIPRFYTAAIEPREAFLSYDFEYKKEAIHISRLEIDVPHVSIRGSGSVQGITRSNRSISLDFTTDRTSIRDIRPYLPDRIIPEKVRSLLADDGIQGFLQVEKARLEGPWAHLTAEGLQRHPEMLSIRIRFDRFRFSVNPKVPPFEDISGLLTLQGDQVGVRDFRGQLLHSQLFELNGSISQIFSNPTLAVTFRGDFDFKGLHGILRSSQIPRRLREALGPLKKVSGKAKVEGKVRHRFKKPSELTYQSRIALMRIRARIAGLPLPLSKLEGEIRCDEKEIRFSHFKWTMGKSLCRGDASLRNYLKRARGKLALSNQVEISFDIGVEEIGLDEFLPKVGGNGQIRVDPKSIWTNSVIIGKMRIAKGLFRGLQFVNFETSFSAKHGLLRFKHFRAEAPGGFLRCGGWINLNSRRGVSFKLLPRIHHLDMGRITGMFVEQEAGMLVSGALDLEGIIVGGGQTSAEITRSLSGNLWFCAKDGRIEGLTARKAEGIPYKQAKAQILIRQGIVSTEELGVNSDAISMIIKGQADLNHKSLDISIGIRPLQTMDKILSNVPVAGWLLAGKDKSILTFLYRVRGKFDDLKVESPLGPNGDSSGR